LKHDKFLFLAKAGPYLKVENATAALAERIESLVSQEHAKWVSAQKPVPAKEQTKKTS